MRQMSLYFRQPIGGTSTGLWHVTTAGPMHRHWLQYSNSVSGTSYGRTRIRERETTRLVIVSACSLQRICWDYHESKPSRVWEERDRWRIHTVVVADDRCSPVIAPAASFSIDLATAIMSLQTRRTQSLHEQFMRQICSNKAHLCPSSKLYTCWQHSWAFQHGQQLVS